MCSLIELPPSTIQEFLLSPFTLHEILRFDILSSEKHFCNEEISEILCRKEVGWRMANKIFPLALLACLHYLLLCIRESRSSLILLDMGLHCVSVCMFLFSLPGARQAEGLSGAAAHHSQSARAHTVFFFRTIFFVPVKPGREMSGLLTKHLLRFTLLSIHICPAIQFCPYPCN